MVSINIHVKETVSVLYAYSKHIIHSCILNYHNHLVQYRQFVYNTPIYILHNSMQAYSDPGMHSISIGGYICDSF